MAAAFDGSRRVAMVSLRRRGAAAAGPAKNILLSCLPGIL
jgi:hypothetical protein